MREQIVKSSRCHPGTFQVSAKEIAREITRGKRSSFTTHTFASADGLVPCKAAALPPEQQRPQSQ